MTTYRSNPRRTSRRRTLAAWWDWWRPGVIATLVAAGALAAYQALYLLGVI